MLSIGSSAICEAIFWKMARSSDFCQHSVSGVPGRIRSMRMAEVFWSVSMTFAPPAD